MCCQCSLCHTYFSYFSAVSSASFSNLLFYLRSFLLFLCCKNVIVFMIIYCDSLSQLSGNRSRPLAPPTHTLKSSTSSLSLTPTLSLPLYPSLLFPSLTHVNELGLTADSFVNGRQGGTGGREAYALGVFHTLISLVSYLC